MSWTVQNLPTALPFYDNWRKQTFRQPFCDGSPLLALSARYAKLLPIMIAGESATPDYVYLVNEAGTNAVDVSDFTALTADTLDGIDYVYSTSEPDVDEDAELTEHTGWNGTTWTTTPGENTWGAFVKCGRKYYLEIKIGSHYYYSDLFEIVDFPETSTDPTNENTARCRIKAETVCRIDDIPADAMTQKLFVNGFTSEPEYLVEDSVSEDGNGEKKVLWAKMKKRYHLKFYAIESVLDFCSMLPLYSTVTISDQNGMETTVSDIDVKATWGDDGTGCLALIDLSFVRDFATYTNCC